jgi:hypothetical protein
MPAAYGHCVHGDALMGALVLGALRYCIVLHATWTVNPIAHFYGGPPYDARIAARESARDAASATAAPRSTCTARRQYQRGSCVAVPLGTRRGVSRDILPIAILESRAIVLSVCAPGGSTQLRWI